MNFLHQGIHGKEQQFFAAQIEHGGVVTGTPDHARTPGKPPEESLHQPRLANVR
jgi:hypothetical protein